MDGDTNVTLELLASGPKDGEASKASYTVNDISTKKGAALDSLFAGLSDDALLLKEFKKWPLASKRAFLIDTLVNGKEFDATWSETKTAHQQVANLGSTGDVMPPDMISSTAADIEKMQQSDAEATAKSLLDTRDYGAFKLGGVFSLMMTNGWFGPYDNFKDYVENVIGYGYRKAVYLAAIYNTLVESGIPWDKVKDLGWSKLVKILPILNNENVDKWVKDAQSVTVLQLEELVKQAKANPGGQQIENQAKPVTTMTFKLHDDQKETVKAAIAKAKEITGTSVDTVALEHIAIDFLNGAPKPVSEQDTQAVDSMAKASVEEPAADPYSDEALLAHFQKVGYEPILLICEKAFPELEMAVTVPD